MLKLILRHRWKFLSGLLFLGAAAGGGAYVIGVTAADADTASASDEAPQGPPPAPVRTAEAVERLLSPLADAPGSVVSVSDSLVAAATAGKIEWVAEIGAEVSEGDVIARIDARDAEAMRDDAEAEVTRLASRADYLARLVERYEGLGAETGEPEATLDQMRADRDQAAQSLQQARVALRRAETTLDRTRVRAPFAGRIAARQIEVGEYATPGIAVARLVDTRNLEVRAQAPANLLAALKPGDKIDVLYATQSVKADVRAIAPAGSEVSRTLELRLALPQTGWPIGAAVRVSLPAAAPRAAVAAHRDALVLRANRVSVFKIDEENIAHQVDVEIGSAEGDYVEIIGEVASGDAVVIRGGERLRDGQKVTRQQDGGTVS
jgi:RND family efflux transporter MFP subunit